MKGREPTAGAGRKPKERRRRPHTPRSPSWAACCTILLPAAICIAACLWSLQQPTWLASLSHLLPPALRPGGRDGAPPSGLVACRSEREDFDALLLQLSAAGANVVAVDLGYTAANRRGLVATQHIPQGATVLSVPLELSLSAATFSGRTRTLSATAAWWGSVDAGSEDADMFLDALALVTELLVRGSASPWALYMCTLPQTPESFGLPQSYRDPWSVQLMQQLPELWRLVQKRSSSIKRFRKLTREAVSKMPGADSAPGASVLGDEAAWSRTFLWGYAATKTRTASLDLQQADASGARVLLRGGGDGGSAAGAQRLLVEPVLPPRLRLKLSDMGVMVPVFDMANHAPGALASTTMGVRFTQRSAADMHALAGGGNGDGGSDVVGVEFSLVAARNISTGEEVTFSYNPEDDEEPICNERWLLEYGFIMEDGRPERNCHTWNISAAEVAAVLASLEAEGEPEGATAPAAQQRQAAAAARRLRVAGLPAWTVARLDGTGTVHAEMVQWVLTAAGPVPEGYVVPGGQGVGVEEAWALRALCGLVRRQQAALGGAVQQAAEQLAEQEGEQGTGEGEGGLKQQRRTLLALARGAVGAAEATAARLAAFC